MKASVKQPINPATTIVAMTMTVADLNTVLDALGELPAKRSHRIINTLQMQAMQQLNPPPPTASDKENLKAADEKRGRKALKLARSNPNPKGVSPAAPPA